MTAISRKFYKEVAASTDDKDSVTIPNGETWIIQDWTGSASLHTETHVCIKWDVGGAGEEILALTHSSSAGFIGRSLVGDGSKVLELCLHNGTTNAIPLGIEFAGRSI